MTPKTYWFLFKLNLKRAKGFEKIQVIKDFITLIWFAFKTKSKSF